MLENIHFDLFIWWSYTFCAKMSGPKDYWIPISLLMQGLFGYIEHYLTLKPFIYAMQEWGLNTFSRSIIQTMVDYQGGLTLVHKISKNPNMCTVSWEVD